MEVVQQKKLCRFGMKYSLSFYKKQPSFSSPVSIWPEACRLAVCSNGTSVTRKKSPNVYKKLPKNDFTRKMIDFDTFTNLPKNVGDLEKLIVTKGFKNFPKVK